MTAGSDATVVTLRELLRLEELAGYEIIAAEGGLDRDVGDVVVAQGGEIELPSNALVVAAYRRTSGYAAELLLRKADTSGAVAVVLTGADRLMLSTRRLAERIGLPLLLLPEADPVHVAWRLSRHVHEPERYAATLVSSLLRRLRNPVSRPADLVAIVDGELTASSTVLSADGAVVAGAEPVGLPPGCLDRPALQHWEIDDGHLLCAPVYVEDVRRPELWLLARIPPSHPHWVEASLQALSAAALTTGTWAARQRLAGERDARDRSALLSELLDAGPSLPRRLAEHAVRVGWRLDGWHTGIHIRLVGEPERVVRKTPRVREALLAAGLDGPVVERADGWACWITEDREPPSSSHREFTTRVRTAVDGLADEVATLAGVGRPYAGPSGIVTTLREAREACLFAGSSRRSGRVEHVDELGVRRVLADWYHAEAFRAYARTLLAPLLDAGEDDLLETLRTYLELESSASSTAAALRIHRNTVAHRIARVEQLLSINLARPDERLVLQLACRVLRSGDTGDAAS